MQNNRLAPSVVEALAKIGRTIPRIGLRPNDEKKVKGTRRKRARRGAPVRNLNMVPADATPEQARAIEMRERAKRREERSQRSLLAQRNYEADTSRKSRSTTDAEKVKAAHLKRERRNLRRFNEAAQGGWKR